MHDSPSPRSAYPLPSLPDGPEFPLLLRDVGWLLPRHGFPAIETETDALLLSAALSAFLLDHPKDTHHGTAGDRYPLPPREGDDLRIVSLVGEAADTLPDHGFPVVRSVIDHTRLAGALHGFLYRTREMP
ncbi:hypothetical protein FNJ62_26720 [Streptomyces benahoarensis]|uniref:Uncharacterized protein n=1 Tax=Streptomyces benahoarensis TaxID=2595054 RepID=A0A553XQ03_9ACTN|nr:hypothetical protein [Streptomyces benahoarensis]TSB17709.1 hypothetical protein FNJ62_26720 [Streptomyces benahoarensis]TSB19081.1 hypothetical protein FNZ23_29395 [Streptomyces benahoarensis]